jgi:hypothetical protein
MTWLPGLDRRHFLRSRGYWIDGVTAWSGCNVHYCAPTSLIVGK